MSHFTVLVVWDNVDTQLSPYNEDIRVERYVSATKAELIAKGKKDIEEYRTTGLYAEYLKDPVAYKEGCSNTSHIAYLEVEFPKRLAWTDEEIYKNETQWYGAADIGANGEVYSTYNPKAKWDWYSEGGRWDDFFLLKNGKRANSVKKWEIDFEGMVAEATQVARKNYKETIALTEGLSWKSFNEVHAECGIRHKAINEYNAQPAIMKMRTQNAFIDPDDYLVSEEEFVIRAGNSVATTYALLMDGKWYEKGEMGWFGMSTDKFTDSQWNEEFYKLIQTLSDNTLLTVIDCHI